MSGLGRAVKGFFRKSGSSSGRSNRSGSGSHRSQDTPMPDIVSGRGPRPQHTRFENSDDESPREPPKVLTEVEHIITHTVPERQILERLVRRTYTHARVFDHDLLTELGIQTDLDTAFGYVGWSHFANICEYGCKLLTMEFLCSLKVVKTKNDATYSFRFFNKEYSLSLVELSTILGFETHKAAVTMHDLKRYDRDTFWEEISGTDSAQRAVTSQILNPTLRVLHRWIACNLTPRDELRRILTEDFAYLFALARKKRINPTVHLVDYWINVRESPTVAISFTSFVTRIATGVGALDNATIEYLDGEHPVLGTLHFVQAHLLKVVTDPHSGLPNYYMLYQRDQLLEIPLPDPRLGLYDVRRLDYLPTPAPARRSVSGPVTRSSTRRQAEHSQPAPQQVPPQAWGHPAYGSWGQPAQQAGWGHPGYQQGWTQPAHAHWDSTSEHSSAFEDHSAGGGHYGQHQDESGPSHHGAGHGHQYQYDAGPAFGPSSSARYSYEPYPGFRQEMRIIRDTTIETHERVVQSQVSTQHLRDDVADIYNRLLEMGYTVQQINDYLRSHGLPQVPPQ